MDGALGRLWGQGTARLWAQPGLLWQPGAPRHVRELLASSHPPKERRLLQGCLSTWVTTLSDLSDIAHEVTT